MRLEDFDFDGCAEKIKILFSDGYIGKVENLQDPINHEEWRKIVEIYVDSGFLIYEDQKIGEGKFRGTSKFYSWKEVSGQVAWDHYAKETLASFLKPQMMADALKRAARNNGQWI